MRLLILLIFTSFSLLLTAQKTIAVTVNTVACSGSLSLYTFDGSAFKPAYTKTGTAGTYIFEIPNTGHHFYYFGPNASSLKPLILGGEENVILEESCDGSKALQIKNSYINKQYQDLKVTFGELAKEGQASVMAFRRGMRDPEQKKIAIEMMAELDKKRLGLLDSLKKANPFLARIAALNTYLSYHNNGTDKYSDEIAYFSREFFQLVDWKDEAYYELPWVYEGFKSYAATLSKVYTNPKDFEAAVDPTFADIPEKTMAEKLALGGLLTVLRQNNHPSFSHYAQQFINHFGMTDPQAGVDLAAEIQRVKGFVVGGEAPNFVQFTPEGDSLQLNELRGKVLLVDFWASWCGPCRKENPHVKRLYAKYKDQGFEVLGVSLDRKKTSWLQAIEKDGLEWLHVSDLKGWKNEVAQMYRVSSIPHTMLLDAEGKIIARGLRGKQLEDKLAQIFNGQ